MRRQRVLHRPQEVKEPFSSDEKSRLLAKAQDLGMVNWVNVRRLCEVFLAIGPHTALFYQASFYQPHIEKDCLVYTRPKNEKPIQFPIPRSMLPWLDEFLGSDFPSSRWWYQRLLVKLGARCGFPTNFLRFRHTALSEALQPPMSLTIPDACIIFGVTPETCGIYGPRRPSEIARSMRERGW